MIMGLCISYAGGSVTNINIFGRKGIKLNFNGEKTRKLTLPTPMLVAFIEFARSLLCAKG